MLTRIIVLRDVKKVEFRQVGIFTLRKNVAEKFVLFEISAAQNIMPLGHLWILPPTHLKEHIHIIDPQ